jgi:hypothetical protein
MKTKIVLITLLLGTQSLYAMDLSKVDSLILRNQEKYQRPKSCPLESKKYSDVLTKLESIKNVFKNNCTSQGADKLNELLTSFQGVEDELKKRNLLDTTVESKIVESVTGDSEATSINGVSFSTLFSNINNVIKKKQCNLDDGRILETTAELIFDSTQFGLLSSSQYGVMVAGAGFITSSALKLLDLMLKQKFDFEKNTDRQSFIKLNCAFFDIRSSLEAEGVLETENTQSREDLRDATAYIEEISQAIKKIDSEKNNQPQVFMKIDEKKVQEKIGNISPIKKSLNKLKDIVNGIKYDSMNLPDESKKMLIITDISKEYENITAQLLTYKNFSVSSIPMLDDSFLQDLKQFNMVDIQSFNEMLKISYSDFNSKIRPSLLFHIVRIVGDIEAKEAVVIAENTATKKEIASKVDKGREDLNKRLGQLNTIKNKLDKIVSAKSYSASDDGSDNIISIIEDYKTVSNLIYGEWGDKFLKYSAQKSADEINNFNERVNRFNKKYGAAFAEISIDKLPLTYMCQDAQRARVNFKYADSLVQEGYDFIVTNKDLFYSDAKNYYNVEIGDGTTNGNGLLGSIEKIQRHYASTVLALRKMKGEEISKADEDKYFSKGFLNNNQYLGRSMLELEKARLNVQKIQTQYEKTNCNKIMKDDLN